MVRFASLLLDHVRRCCVFLVGSFYWSSFGVGFSELQKTKLLATIPTFGKFNVHSQD